ncbi:hypothetical protein [Ancylobacter sp. SL191]|uniref:hypothetical protein n=1 Tax=Ancylobacter sp. SL191 TaxID=2995166 RepID=UPI0022721AB2|nr:hypothetical protein [Ancylobacter sp. SL191]WAC26531.1 hypothetical protein OU996_16135 [Ancylobacter sp. SL191]
MSGKALEGAGSRTRWRSHRLRPFGKYPTAKEQTAERQPDGITEPDEMLKEQIAKLKADRDRAHSALERIENQGAAASRLDSDKLARFGQLIRSNITGGEAPFRKAYL